jgi:isoleucyl-tRNA synthetase
LDGAEVAARLEAGEAVEVSLGDGPVRLGPGDLELRVRSQPGFAVSRVGGEVVALELALDEDLRLRGTVREVVRLVQDLRRASGLAVSDRIELHLSGLDELAPHFAAIGREVLADRVVTTAGAGEGSALDVEGYPDARAWITVERTGSGG